MPYVCSFAAVLELELEFAVLDCVRDTSRRNRRVPKSALKKGSS